MGRTRTRFSSLRRPFLAALWTVLLLSVSGLASAQARREVAYDYSPNQLTVLYQRTIDDYSVQNPDGSTSEVTLNGAVAEYAWTRYYPFEIVGRASYSLGQPLGQKLFSFTGGAGYTRQILGRYFPFARVTAGLAHTSSTGHQYLYNPGKSGFAVDIAGGLDINLTPRWGIRAIEVQNQYLPFGIDHQSSVYWSFGAGAYIHFGK